MFHHIYKFLKLKVLKEIKKSTMNTNDYNGCDEYSEEKEDQSETQTETETIVVTQTKDREIKNKLTIKLGENTTYSVSGWKACMTETIVIGLMLGGAILMVSHAGETLGNTNSFWKLFTRSS